MFNDTITIYNKYSDGGAEKWQKAELHGVYWNAVKGAVTRKTGISTADSVVIIIPKNIACDSTYVPPKAFAALSSKTGCWTLASKDTVVKGGGLPNIERSSSELKALDDVLTITAVDYKDFGGNMAHWEVSGK